MWTDDDWPACILPKYSEKAARSKLTRHRLRGDFSRSMLWCRICESWHVLDTSGSVDA